MDGKTTSNNEYSGLSDLTVPRLQSLQRSDMIKPSKSQIQASNSSLHDDMESRKILASSVHVDSKKSSGHLGLPSIMKSTDRISLNSIDTSIKTTRPRSIVAEFLHAKTSPREPDMKNYLSSTSALNSSRMRATGTDYTEDGTCKQTSAVKFMLPLKKIKQKSPKRARPL